MPDYPLPPIIGVDQYKNDLVVKRRGGNEQSGGGKRKQVRTFSKASRSRLAFTAGNTSVVFRTMVTLTYPRQYPRDGRRVKRDLRTFLAAWRRYTGGCELLWFLEFQKRGAPHVHILCDFPLPRRREDAANVYRWVALRWYQICGELDYKHLQAGTRTERLRSARGGAHYAVKYAQKMHQKVVPDDYQNVGRFWGHTRGVKPEPIHTYRCTEDDIRGLLDGWQFAPDPDRPVYHTLYNCSERLTHYMAGRLDKAPDKVYTRSESESPRAPPKRKKGE